jgi:hypothetical protein
MTISFSGKQLRVLPLSNGRFSFAAFASLRLGENRRLNKKAYFSQRRKGAKAPLFCERDANEVFYGLDCGPAQVGLHFLQSNQQAQG